MTDMSPRPSFKRHESGLYLYERESFRLYMKPIFFLKNCGFQVSSENHQKEVIFSLLQRESLRLLSSFLNGENSTHKSRYLYPLLDLLYTHELKTLQELLWVCDVCDPSVSRVFQKSLANLVGMVQQSRIGTDCMAKFLGTLYENLARYREGVPLELTKKEVPITTVFDNERYSKKDRSFLLPIRQLAEQVQQRLNAYVKSYLLHGSLSTMDYVKGWSDVDTLVILKASTLSDYRCLLEARRQLLLVSRIFFCLDPLQHHRHFFITELDMQAYPQPYFPFVLFDFSTAMALEENPMVFFERSSVLDRERVFWDMCYYYRWLYIEQRKLETLSQWKEFFSGLLILPALYLQLMGQYSYKRYSFERARATLTSDAWAIMDKITKIRNDFEVPGYLYNHLARLIAKIVNPFHFHILQQTFLNKLSDDWKNLSDRRFLDLGCQLSKTLLQNSRDKGYLS